MCDLCYIKSSKMVPFVVTKLCGAITAPTVEGMLGPIANELASVFAEAEPLNDIVSNASLGIALGLIFNQLRHDTTPTDEELGKAFAVLPQKYFDNINANESEDEETTAFLNILEIVDTGTLAGFCIQAMAGALDSQTQNQMVGAGILLSIAGFRLGKLAEEYRTHE